MFVDQIFNQMKNINSQFINTINLPDINQIEHHIKLDLLVHIMYRVKYKIDDRIVRRLKILTSEQLNLELLKNNQNQYEKNKQAN